MTSQRILGIAVIGIFAILIIVTVGRINRHKFKLTAEEMQEIALETDYVLNQKGLDSLIKNGEKPVTIIDLREPEAFQVDHPEGAINIPLSILLEDESLDNLKGEFSFVLYNPNMRVAHQAWMLLTQVGYQGLYVLEETNQEDPRPVIPVSDLE